jgi:hypothetical protein
MFAAIVAAQGLHRERSRFDPYLAHTKHLVSPLPGTVVSVRRSAADA